MDSTDEIKKYYVHARYIGIIAVLFILFAIKSCMDNRHTNNLLAAIASYRDSATQVKTKYGIVNTNKALALDDSKQLKQYLSAMSDTMKELLSKYKNIASVVKTKEYFYFRDSIKIMPGSIPCDFKPFIVNKKEKHYFFRGIISPDQFTIDSLYIPNTQTIVVGEKKKGFLNLRRQYTVDVTNSNPYMYTPNLAAYTINNKPKWHERRLVNFGIGLAAGFIGGRVTAPR